MHMYTQRHMHMGMHDDSSAGKLVSGTPVDEVPDLGGWWPSTSAACQCLE